MMPLIRPFQAEARARLAVSRSPTLGSSEAAGVPSANPAQLVAIAPGVYEFQDTCNVYAIVKGNEAMLIDFGSGDILNVLPSVGVRKVDWILHTNFHRGHTQGDELAKAQGIKIAVPESERKYFENVEALWNAKKVFDLYDMRDEFLARRQNIAVDFDLKPGTKFAWNGLELEVIGTPGHTEGSVSFKFVTGGKTLLFCGDLVASEGKIPTMHDLEWDYVGTHGILAEMGSLNLVHAMAPDMMLPSHGTPSQDPEAWTPLLLARLAKIYHEYDWIHFSLARPNPGPVQLTRHVWQMRRTFADGVGYLIVGDSGRAMLWDVNAGEVSFLAEMQKIAGFKSIDVIVPSHYHDDHVGGINATKKKYGSQLWAMDHLVDVLQHPMAYNLPCLWREPMTVDRVLHDGEKIEFDGMPLQFFYLPGQTEYTEGLLLNVDGKRLLFDGDNVAHPLPGMPLFGHFVCRNYQRIGGGHVYSAKKLLELKPDYVCPNHFEWNVATPEILESYLKSSAEVQDTWKEIIDQPDPEIGVDNSWASLYPYQAEADPGDTIHYELRIRNWINRPSHLRVVIRSPQGWTVPSAVEIDVTAKGEAAGSFDVKIPRSENRLNRRFALTADIWRDGEHLGEVTEGLINMKPMTAH
jgi:glyoxylase-like metal-dependent hydrolase (beta-lactamase superfamily II)